MIRIGIEFDRQTINGKTYRRIAPFIEGSTRIAGYIAAAAAFAAFAFVAMQLTDTPDTHPTVTLTEVIR